MNGSTIDQWRAHLLVASLAATLVQGAVLAAMLVLGVPEIVFTSLAFRTGVVVVVLAALMLTRRLANSAFHSALASNHARLGGTRQLSVSLSAGCPRRALVVLYVRLNRRKFDLSVS